MSSQQQVCNQFLYQYFKDHPCLHCHETDILLLECHHRNPKEKLYNIADLRNQGKLELLQEEIKKCDSLCVSCHRKITSFQNTWWRSILISEEELELERFDNDTIESLENGIED